MVNKSLVRRVRVILLHLIQMESPFQVLVYFHLELLLLRPPPDLEQQIKPGRFFNDLSKIAVQQTSNTEISSHDQHENTNKT